MSALLTSLRGWSLRFLAALAALVAISNYAGDLKTLNLGYKTPDGRHLYYTLNASKNPYGEDCLTAGCIKSNNYDNVLRVEKIPGSQGRGASIKASLLRVFPQDHNTNLMILVSSGFTLCECEIFRGQNGGFVLKWTETGYGKGVSQHELAGVGGPDLDIFREKGQASTVVDLGVLLTLMEAWVSRPQHRNGQHRNGQPVGDDLTEMLSQLTLAPPPKGYESLLKTVAANEEKECVLQDNGEMQLSVSTMPVHTLTFPQKITRVPVTVGKTWYFGDKTDHLSIMTCEGVPQQGALVGPLFLQPPMARCADTPCEAYALLLHLQKPASQREDDEIKISLFPVDSKSLEHSVREANPKMTLTIRQSGDFILQKEDGAEYKNLVNRELDIPILQKNFEEKLIAQVNLTALLSLAKLLREFSNNEDWKSEAAGINHHIRYLFSVPSQPKKYLGKDISVDKEEDYSSSIVFTDSHLHTRVKRNPADPSLGAVYGPIYASPPEGAGYYCFHVTSITGGGYRVVRYRSGSLDDVWAGILRERATGLPFSFDHAWMQVQVNEEGQVVLFMGNPHEQTLLRSTGSNKWEASEKIDISDGAEARLFPSLGEAFQILSYVSGHHLVSSNSIRTANDSLVTRAHRRVGGNASSSLRDYSLIPHQESWPVRAIKSVPQLPRVIWNQRKSIAATGISLGVAVGAAYAADKMSPEDSQAFWKEAGDMTVYTLKNLLQYTHLDSYCPPCPVESETSELITLPPPMTPNSRPK